MTGPPVAADEDDPHDPGQEGEIVGALDPEGLTFLLSGRHQGLPLLFPEVIPVDEVEEDQEDRGGDQHVGQDVRRHPEEGDVVEEPQEEGRIAQRGKGAADIGHEEDEKTEDVCLSHALFVGPQDRPDHHHRGARRTDPGGHHRPDQEHHGVDGGRALERSPHHDPAGYGEKPPEEDDEGDIVDQEDLEDLQKGDVAVGIQKGQGEQERPECRYLSEMVVPEMGRQERKQGDR